MYSKSVSHYITALCFALLNGRAADSPRAVVRHSIRQYLQNSSVTQGSLECQAHCSAAPTSFLLKGNISVRVVEAFAHIPVTTVTHKPAGLTLTVL